MGSMERASHLSSLSALAGKQPSIFDILSHENLGNSIRPAMAHLTKYLAIFKPDTFLKVHRNFDEYYLAFDLLLQNYFLKRYGASFSENFYSLKRVSTKTNEMPRDGREKAASIITLVLWPYVENKINKIHDRLKEIYENRSWNSIHDSKSKAQKLFVVFWPYLKTILTGVKTILQILYILNRSTVHSPFLWFSGVKLFSLTPQDLSDLNSVPLHLQTGFFNRIWRFILGLPGVLSRLFGYGLFFVQFLDFMQNNEQSSQLLSKIGSGHAPAPHRKLLNEAEVMSLETHKCPICLKKRENDTALYVSGYVFCYTCINQYVNTYHKCPVTNIPATNQQLIRLFI